MTVDDKNPYVITEDMLRVIAVPLQNIPELGDRLCREMSRSIAEEIDRKTLALFNKVK